MRVHARVPAVERACQASDLDGRRARHVCARARYLHINCSLASVEQHCTLAPAALRMPSCHVTPRDSTHGIYRVHVRRNSICREPVTGCMSGPKPELS